MRNFDENALFTQGGSALDCFRGERNQKSILDEISAFGDEELNASYQRFFEAQKYRVDGELVEMMIKEDLDQSFVTYAEHIEMTYYLFMLLRRLAHGKIKDLMQKTKMFNHSPKFTR